MLGLVAQTDYKTCSSRFGTKHEGVSILCGAPGVMEEESNSMNTKVTFLESTGIGNVKLGVSEKGAVKNFLVSRYDHHFGICRDHGGF